MSTYTDVFLRTAANHSIRSFMYLTVWERLRLEPDIAVHVLTATKGEELEDFAFRSRSCADTLSRSDWYFLVDDDTLPVGPLGWFRDFRKLVEEDRQFQFVSAGRVIEAENVVGKTPFLIAENPGVGAPYIQKKGIIPYSELSGPANQQDGIVGEWCKKNGIRQGVARDFRVNHLGFGFSQVEPKLWLRY